MGTVSSMLMVGLLAGAIGWEAVFYLMSALSCIWVVLWYWLVQDNPNKQPYITEEERTFITTSLGTNPLIPTEGKPPFPWKAIFTSGPFLAIFIAHICCNWGWYMLLIELPFYMKQVLKLHIKENAIATALPFFTMWLFSMGLSNTLDRLRANRKITTTQARKTATLFSSAIPMFCLLVICFIGCQRGLAVALLGIGVIIKSYNYS